MSADDGEFEIDFEEGDGDYEEMESPAPPDHPDDLTFVGQGGDSGPQEESLTSQDGSQDTQQGTALGMVAAAMNRLGDMFATIVQGQQTFQESMLNRETRRPRKVYTNMPKEFDGAIGDKIVGWLEKFENWFDEREKVEGTIDPQTRINTAVHNTKQTIFLTLRKHQNDYGAFATWDDFANHMKRTYDSKETSYQKFMRLRAILQGDSESLDGYYGRYQVQLSRQELAMERPGDNYPYNFLFIEQMNQKVRGKYLEMPEAANAHKATLQDVLVHAKRAEQAVNGATLANQPSHAGPIRHGKHGSGKGGGRTVRGGHSNSHSANSGKDSHEKSEAALTDSEKRFLKTNISQGGGRVIHKKTRMKSEWMGWARKANVCSKCAASGHHWKDCPAKEPDSTNKSDKRLNAVGTSHDVHSDHSTIDGYSDYLSSLREADCEHLYTLTKRKYPLMIYRCTVKNHKGKACTDCAATRNFVSKEYALKSNLKILDRPNRRDVKLPNGHTMKIEGYCEFEIQLGDWKGTIRAIVIDMKAEFDVVLGLEWLRETRPIPDWDTFDWYIQTDEGIVRIAYEFDLDANLHERPKLSLLEAGDVGLSFNMISCKEAEKIMRQKGSVGILHFAKTPPGDDRQVQSPKVTSQAGADHPTLSNLEDFDEWDVDDPALQELLGEFKDLFKNPLPKGLPPARVVDHAIDTGSEKPVNKNAYPLSVQQLREQAKQVQELLECELIRESSSPWGAPVLFVAKKTPGEWRMCIDYRMLNAKTLRNMYPLPRIQECLDKLGNATSLSSIDLTSGFWQIRVAEGDVPKTAFNTRYGKYEFLVMPFGLTNAPATFQTLMNSILRPYIDKFVLVYMDDILVYSNSEEEHRHHLRLVFEALRKAKLYANPLKCSFNKPTAEFCGHEVGQGVIKVLHSKVKAIREWPQPRTVHDVRQFYGLVNYYRRFIRNFSIIGAPLSDLFKTEGDPKDKRKNRPVVWNMAHQMAFDRLKEAITSAPVLIQPDETKPYTIETDSSDFGNGMALLQMGDDGKLHPVAFDGRKLHGAELRYPTHEKELLAIKDAITRWRVYIDNGLPVTVITDHDSLKYMNTMTNPSKRLARWVEEFQSYNLHIRYRPGKLATVPDALSRRPDYLNAITLGKEEYIPLIQTFLEEHTLPQDPELKKLVMQDAGKFQLEDGEFKEKILHRKIRDGVTAPYIEFPFRGDTMQSFHTQYGHLGIQSLSNIFESRAWWPTIEKDLKAFIAACPNCQVHQPHRRGVEREYAHIVSDKLVQPFQRWGIDLIGVLPKTRDGNRWIITAIDYATGWPIAKAVPKATEDAIAEFIFDEIYMHYGAPQEIFTDMGANLSGKVVEAYLKRISTLHKRSTAYHPRTNGKVERLNGILGGMLAKFMLGKPTRLWDLYLDQALFACRVRTHTTTKTSPFYLLYGRHPHLLGDPNEALPTEALPDGFERRLQRVQMARTEANRAIYERAMYSKSFHDELVRPHQFTEGEWVLVRHENRKKFEVKWFGPYQITECMMLGTYQLQSPGGLALAHLVHGNRLARARVSEIDKLKKLWASPKSKNTLRAFALRNEWEEPTPENTAILEQLLRDMDQEVDLPPPKPVKKAPAKSKATKNTVREQAPNPLNPAAEEEFPPIQTKFTINLKRMQERQAIEEIFSEPPAKRRKTS